MAYYEFRIAKRGFLYIVQERTCNYNYGERLGDYGWCNAAREEELKHYFKESYHTLKGAKEAIKGYREGSYYEEENDEVVWTEGDE